MNKIGRLMVFAMFALLFIGMMIFIFTISKGSGKSIGDANSEAAGHYFDKEVVNIISAEHLSKDRKIISNIYERVRELDDKWSKKIKSEEYVRIKFERNLTNDRDITIYHLSNSSQTLFLHIPCS